MLSQYLSSYEANHWGFRKYHDILSSPLALVIPRYTPLYYNIPLLTEMVLYRDTKGSYCDTKSPLVACIILRCSKLYYDTMLLPIVFIILRYSKLYRDTTHYDILIIFIVFLCLLFIFPPEPAKRKFAKYSFFPIQNQSNIYQDC